MLPKLKTYPNLDQMKPHSPALFLLDQIRIHQNTFLPDDQIALES